MCDMPNCKLHKGPILKPVTGLIRHCDTAELRNSDCPYLPLGCLGCTYVDVVVDEGVTDNPVTITFTKGPDEPVVRPTIRISPDGQL